MGCGFHPFFTILALLRLLLQLFLQARSFLVLLLSQSCSGWFCSFWLRLQLILYPGMFQLEQTSKISVEICALLESDAQKCLSSA